MTSETVSDDTTLDDEERLCESQAPERIFLNICDERDCTDPFAEHEVTWTGETAVMDVAVEYVRASRATPQDGPCVWVARDEDGCARIFTEPPTLHTDGMWMDHFGNRIGSTLLTGVKGQFIAAALGLAPGACQRFRLVPEGEP